MIRKLKAGALLIVFGELIAWISNYAAERELSSFGGFASGVLLGISVGMKLVGIVLLFIFIVKYQKK